MDGKIADRKGYEYMRKLSGSTEPPDPNQVCFVNSTTLYFISLYRDKLESIHKILLSILNSIEVEVTSRIFISCYCCLCVL